MRPGDHGILDTVVGNRYGEPTSNTGRGLFSILTLEKR